MRVLVTGGSGFVGTNAVEALLVRGEEVMSVDVKEPMQPGHRGVYRRLDLRDRDSVVGIVHEWRPDAVLHLAARTDLEGRSAAVDYATNIAGVTNVVAAIDAVDCVRHVVFASSRLVYPAGRVPRDLAEYEPENPYGQSKMLGEQIVRSAGPREAGWTIVRPTSVWGPWFGTPNLHFFRLIARGHYVHPGTINPVKQYSYVENAVAQMLRLIEAPRELVHERVFYLADYEPLRLLEWADEIRRVAGAPPMRSLPCVVLRLAAAAGDVLAPVWKGVPLTSFRLANMRAAVQFDLSELRSIAPTLPVPWQEGVVRTLAWMGEHGLTRAS